MAGGFLPPGFSRSSKLRDCLMARGASILSICDASPSLPAALVVEIVRFLI